MNSTHPKHGLIRRGITGVLRVLFVVFVAAGAAGIWVWIWIDDQVLSRLPDDLSSLHSWRPPSSVEVMDAHGALIDSFYVERRVWRDLKDLPPHVWQAFIAAEDRRFFDHPGVDVLGIARAMWTNLQAGSIEQGGSTLTQQLVKVLIVGDERSYKRKVEEAILAWRLERELSKEEILGLYINLVFLGAGNYGVEAAAQDYFGVPAEQLDPGQAALIAGLIPAPSRYQPRRYPERAKVRRALVLRTMVEEGYVDPIDAIDYQSDPVVLAPGRVGTTGVGSAYATLVRREVRRLFGSTEVYKANLKVHTPYDAALATTAQEALRAAVAGVVERQGGTPPEASAVVLENTTGRVLAVVDSTDVPIEGFVRATQARRQPGSSFKPYVYAAALKAGHSQLDVMVDAPLALPAGGGKTWSPKNYAGAYAGPVTLRQALARSMNTIAVRLILEVGTSEVARLARDLGIQTPLRQDPTIALGSSEVTPMDQALAYSAIARLGVAVQPVYIDRLELAKQSVVAGQSITLKSGELTLPGQPGPRVLDAGVAYELIDMMREVVAGGTARRAWRPGLDRIGKTGTTNDYIDAWFVGSTPRYTVAVWVGSTSQGSMGDAETGGKAALPAWITIVEALDQPAAERFPVPDHAMITRIDGRWLGLARGRIPQRALPWKDLGEAPLAAFPGGSP